MIDWKRPKAINELEAGLGSVSPLWPEKARRTAIGTEIVTDDERHFREPFKEVRRVELTRDERKAHTHVIGGSGSGKSKLLEHLIRQYLDDPQCGLTLLDPHGSLYDAVVQYIASYKPRLAKRVILFNPAQDKDYIVGFNPIAARGASINYLVQTTVAACLKAWGQHEMNETPRITRWLENIFTLVIAAELTIIESYPLYDINDIDKRQKLIEYAANRAPIDAAVLNDWEAFDGEKVRPESKTLTIEGAANRLRAFVRDEFIRNIIGQRRRTLDFQRIMDEGSILLINLRGIDQITKENAKMLGVMLINEMYRAAMLRDLQNKKLKPHFAIIDEFPRFITQTIADGLEECRKFGLFFTLAHQHLAQLKGEDEYLYYSVLGNCRNKIAMGSLHEEDARVMTDDLTTGYLDLKSIKHVQERITHRYREEVRHSVAYGRNANHSTGASDATATTSGASVSHGTTTTAGQGRQESFAFNHNRTASQGTSDALAQGKATSNAQGHTDGRGVAEGSSVTDARSWSQSKGVTDTTMHSETKGKSITHSESTSRHQSRTSGAGGSHTDSYSSSRSSTEGESHTKGGMHSKSLTVLSERTEVEIGEVEAVLERKGADGSVAEQVTVFLEPEIRETVLRKNETLTLGQNWADTTSHSHSTGYTEGNADTRSWNESDTAGRSRAKGKAVGFSQQVTDGYSHAESVTDTIGGSHAEGRSHVESQMSSDTTTTTNTSSETSTHATQQGSSEGSGVTVAHATSSQQSASVNDGVTLTASQSHTTTASEQRGEGHNLAVTATPVHIPYEHIERTPTFWTKDELHYILKAAMMSQGVAEAFVKVGNRRPARVRVDRVADAPDRPERVERLRRAVIEQHPDVYTDIGEAVREIEERQRPIFAVPLYPRPAALLSAPKADAEAETIEEPPRKRLFNR